MDKFDRKRQVDFTSEDVIFVLENGEWRLPHCLRKSGFLNSIKSCLLCVGATPLTARQNPGNGGPLNLLNIKFVCASCSDYTLGESQYQERKNHTHGLGKTRLVNLPSKNELVWRGYSRCILNIWGRAKPTSDFFPSSVSVSELVFGSVRCH